MRINPCMPLYNQYTFYSGKASNSKIHTSFCGFAHDRDWRMLQDIQASIDIAEKKKSHYQNIGDNKNYTKCCSIIELLYKLRTQYVRELKLRWPATFEADLKNYLPIEYTTYINPQNIASDCSSNGIRRNATQDTGESLLLPKINNNNSMLDSTVDAGTLTYLNETRKSLENKIVEAKKNGDPVNYMNSTLNHYRLFAEKSINPSEFQKQYYGDWYILYQLNDKINQTEREMNKYSTNQNYIKYAQEYEQLWDDRSNLEEKMQSKEPDNYHVYSMFKSRRKFNLPY